MDEHGHKHLGVQGRSRVFYCYFIVIVISLYYIIVILLLLLYYIIIVIVILCYVYMLHYCCITTIIILFLCSLPACPHERGSRVRAGAWPQAGCRGMRRDVPCLARGGVE